MTTVYIPEWEWDPSHHPLPLTPAFGSVYPRWVEAAMRVTFAEFGLLAESVEVQVRDGYPYTRVKPVGLQQPPPGWVARVGLRLWWLHPAVASRVQRSVRRIRGDHSTRLLLRWETRWRRAILAEQSFLRAVAWPQLSDDALAAGIAHLMQRTERWVIIHFLLHSAIAIPVMRLQRFLEEKAVGGVRLIDLLSGSSAASSAPARALRELAGTLRSEDDLLSRAAALPADVALRTLREGSPRFAEELDHYLTRFGQGTAGRYEFAVPTLAEQPEMLLPAILSAARAPRSDSVTGSSAERLVEETAARLREPEVERRFRSLVFAARRAYAVRDDNVQITFTDAFGLCRIALLAAGARLVQRGLFESADDVFFLTVPETVTALRRGVPGAADLVQRRRSQWQAAATHRPPRGIGRRVPFVGFDGLPAEAREANEAIVGYLREIMAPPDVYQPPPAGEREVRGVGAARGRYTGAARVLKGEQDFDRLAPGDVLVCPITSPAWAPVLPLAGALVTDYGGVLSHPAVIAREFGIPAVVATRRGTALIPDGALVEVDGTSGVVRILRRP